MSGTRPFLTVFLVFCAFARPSIAAALDVAPLLARHGFAAEDVALVVETFAGETPTAHRADAAGTPASTLKLLTAVGVLERFGAEHRFATRLLLRGDPMRPIVILEGGGDPELDLDGLMRLALALRSSGVTTAAGFLVDDDALPRLPVVDPTMPVEDAYNAGFGALNLAFNRVRVRDDGAGRRWTLPPLAERWQQRYEEALPIRDPGLHAANVLRRLTNSLGIVLPTPVRGGASTADREIGRVWSKTTAGLVQDMLLYSNNQLAEILGFAATGEATQATSAAVLLGQVVALAPDTAIETIVAPNHSGLTPTAAASPQALVDLLRLGDERYGLLAMLPVSGWSGSLAGRFADEGSAMRVWAKTGSLDYALALAGLILPRRGPPLLFALLIGDAQARLAYDRVRPPDGAMRRAAAAWAVRARDLRDAIVAELLAGKF